MDIIVLLSVTAVIAAGGIWLITRDTKPLDQPERRDPA